MKRIFALLVIIFTMAVIPTQSVQACETNVTVQMSKPNADEPMADSIVKKLRMKNGKMQYRRWNETRGYWVDPDWIDID